jgi:hypothetical protein
MRSSARTAAFCAAVLMSACLAGCGGSDKSDGEKEPHKGFSAAADLSTCKAQARPAATPYGDGFPKDWPFPPQSVVFNAEDRGAEGTIVTAVSAAPFKTVLHTMNREVVAKGYKIEKGETEEADAEAEWRGNGFRGRWAIRKSGKCPGETVVQVLSTSH